MSYRPSIAVIPNSCVSAADGMSVATIKGMTHPTPRASAVLLLTALLLFPVTGHADGPGRGKTAGFEREFLQFIMDHHYAALRMTELAAGTDPVRDAAIAASEGTAPTPDFGSTPAKSGMDQIKSMARMANRAQREEIMSAARMLREWYGVSYQPRVRSDARAMIDVLSTRNPGAEFDQAFLTMFPRHHVTAVQSASECLVARDPAHDDLQRYCRGIVEAQLVEIDTMRHLLCKQFNICDSIPFDVTTASRQPQ